MDMHPPTDDTPPRRRWGLVTAAVLAAMAIVGAAAMVVADPFRWLPSRAVDACASRKAMDKAEALGESALAEFSARCSTGQLAAEARQRLDRLIDLRESRLFDSAGNDLGRIKSYLADCKRCSDRGRAEARLASTAAEERTYREAVGHPDRLQAYVEQCRICEHKSQAQQAIGASKLAARQQEEEIYRNAAGSADRLQAYVGQCRICQYKSQAERAIATLKAAAAAKELRASDEYRTFMAARHDPAKLQEYLDRCTICASKQEALNSLDDERKAASVRAAEALRRDQDQKPGLSASAVAPESTTGQLPQAPVGHRQPIRSEVEIGATSNLNQVLQEMNRALSKKLNSICRGCAPSAAAGVVPQYDVDAICREDAAVAAQVFGPDKEGCKRTEREARDQLVKGWTKYGRSDRESCVFLASQGIAHSYIHLLTCLDMAEYANTLLGAK